MKLIETEKTWICQLGKPENKKVLEEFKARRDGSPEESVRYYQFIRDALEGTPAWKVSGVNKMFNELTAGTIAKLTNAKSGKTSAFSHANSLLNSINYHGNDEAKPVRKENFKLGRVLSDLELSQLLEQSL